MRSNCPYLLPKVSIMSKVSGTLVLTASELASMSTETLFDELAVALTTTADSVYRMAIIWKELERRKADLTRYARKGLVRFLPAIATRQLASEAVIAFLASPLKLEAMRGLPLPLQRKLASGFRLAVYDAATGEIKKLTVGEINSSAAIRLFEAGKVLSPAKQKKLFLKDHNSNGDAGSRRSYRYRPIVTKATKTLQLGGIRVPTQEVVNAMAAAAGSDIEVSDSPGRSARIIACRVTDEEKVRLQDICRKTGLSEHDLVRRAVFALWLL